MKSQTAISIVMTLCLALAGSAFAKGNDHNDKHERNEQAGDHGNWGENRNNQKHAKVDKRGAGPRHDLHKGKRLPNQYRNKQYVVNDWRGHHLSAPPRGYHWVQTGGDYVLVSIGSGIILNIFLN